jgi:hypothetical protein
MPRGAVLAAVLWLTAQPGATSAPNTGTAAFSRIIPGARAPALGGGIAAIDDESGAVQSNPAGLARLAAPATVALDAGLPGGGGYLFYAGVAGWVTQEFAVGVTALYLDQGPIELRASNTLAPDALGQASATALTIAGAGRLLPPVDFGISFRYMTTSVTDPDLPDPILSGSGISADAGLLYRPWQRVTIAAVALDVLPAGIDWSTNGRGDIFRRTFRAGGSVDLNPVLVVVQMDDLAGPYRRVRGGAEWDLHPLVTLRAGLDGSHPAGGFGFRTTYGKQLNIRFDYALAVTPLGGTAFQHRAAVTFDWIVPDWPKGQLIFPSEEPSPRGTPAPPRRPPPLFTWPL